MQKIEKRLEHWITHKKDFSENKIHKVWENQTPTVISNMKLLK